MSITTDTAAKLRKFADAGDIVAEALVQNSKDIKLVAGTEATNVIKVTGQVVDGVGLPVQGVKDVLVTSVPVSGAGTMTDGGAGTFKVGSGTKQVWLQTDATGLFQVDVLNAAAEDNLVQAVVADGSVALLKITFA
jgi:hypothetical protein